jgi:ankyrin repeat protein
VPKSLPQNPNIEWLRKTAKERLAELRMSNSSAKLHQAQLDVSREFGFASWRALKARVDALSLDGQIVRATLKGEARELTRLLDEHPRKINVTGGTWNLPLLHLAAEHGQPGSVDVLLKRGFPVDLRDKADNVTALYWAAHSGNTEVIERLLKSGADVHAEGDAHGVGLIGWTAFFSASRPEAAKLLIARGARPNIFGAIAINREDLVREIIDDNPAMLEYKLPSIEHERTPLHVAVSKNLPDMVMLLLELSADIRARDHDGKTPLNLSTSRTDKSIVAALIAAGADPKEQNPNTFDTVVPILNVKNVPASLEYYIGKLGFVKHWESGSPPNGASVGRGRITIFLFENMQGNPGTWLWIGMQDVDALHEEYKQSGAAIIAAPVDCPWGSREMQVKDPDGHVLRMASEVTGAVKSE